jgi:RNA polymerase sigma-70 factor (ECF subfamily)
MSGVQTIPAGTPAAAVAFPGASGACGVTAQRRLLEAVWPEQAGSLAALAVGMGLQGDAAADVLQEVYLTAMRQPPPIADEVGLVRWLFRVTANRCRLEHRRRGRWRRAWQAVAGAWRGKGSTADAPIGELARDVDAALSRLTDADRLLVVLRYFANQNSRQIAEIVDQPEATVRGRLRAVRQRLAEELAGWE